MNCDYNSYYPDISLILSKLLQKRKITIIGRRNSKTLTLKQVMLECIKLQHDTEKLSVKWVNTSIDLDYNLDYNLLRVSNTPLTKQEYAYLKNDIVR